MGDGERRGDNGEGRKRVRTSSEQEVIFQIGGEGGP